MKNLQSHVAAPLISIQGYVPYSMPYEIKLQTLFFLALATGWYSFDFQFDSVCFMVPFAFHLCCFPLVVLCISNCSWFKSLLGFQWSHLALTPVHLPQWVQCWTPESPSKPCFKFTNISANWPVPASVTDVWGTLAPGLALHDKVPLWGTVWYNV